MEWRYEYIHRVTDHATEFCVSYCPFGTTCELSGVKQRAGTLSPNGARRGCDPSLWPYVAPEGSALGDWAGHMVTIAACVQGRCRDVPSFRTGTNWLRDSFQLVGNR